jgi:hypothetical protein
MPDATITSTASTFGTISGTFAADQSTVTGTVTGIVAGTLTGSVGVPGPQGPAGPGSTWGGIVGTLSAQTDLWTELGTKYLASNPSGFITSSALTPYLTTATAASTYQTLAGMSSYLTTSAAAAGYYPLAGNPSGFLTAASLSGYATESFVTSQGYITSSALTPYLLKSGGIITGDIQSNNGSGYRSYDGLFNQVNLSATIIQLLKSGGGGGALSVEWDGITFLSGKQTVHYPGAATLFANSVLTGSPIAPTPDTSDNDTSIATTAFVKAQGYLTSAPVTSVAGRTGAITLSNTDISGLGSMAVVNDAPSNGSQYARKNAAWDVVISGDRYLTTSTTSNTISNGNKTFTIGTGLSYTPTQNITISYDASNHMHGEVLTYNSGTGVLTVDINHHTGSGTYAAWVVNVGGVTPATSVAWGAITGTLSAQTDLQSALDLKLTATTAASTYYPLVGNPSGFLTSAPVTSVAGRTGAITLSNTDIGGLGTLAVVNDAPSDGSQYARRNAAWEAVAAAGASVTISATAPVSPSAGDLWLRTTDYRTFTWTGSQWIESSAGYVSEIGSTFETVSKNLNAYPATLAYSSGLLTSITYALGGGLTIVKTFNRTGANLTSIVLSGYTPGGISLTKTLTYSSGNLVGISYS